MNSKIVQTLTCPISKMLIREPVILSGDGQLYEKEQIELWLSKNSTSPLTGLPLSDTNLVFVYSIKAIIDILIENDPMLIDTMYVCTNEPIQSTQTIQSTEIIQSTQTTEPTQSVETNQINEIKHFKLPFNQVINKLIKPKRLTIIEDILLNIKTEKGIYKQIEFVKTHKDLDKLLEVVNPILLNKDRSTFVTYDAVRELVYRSNSLDMLKKLNLHNTNLIIKDYIKNSDAVQTYIKTIYNIS